MFETTPWLQIFKFRFIKKKKDLEEVKTLLATLSEMIVTINCNLNNKEVNFLIEEADKTVQSASKLRSDVPLTIFEGLGFSSVGIYWKNLPSF